MKFRRDLLQRLRETPELFREIQDAAASELALQQRLRERYDPDLVRAALSVAVGRKKATTRPDSGPTIQIDHVAAW